ncbi:C-C motif chemokine 36.1 [Neosynchiropus ocellatus]
MRTGDIILLCFVTAALLCGATCSYVGPKSCCFEFIDNEVTRAPIVGYQMADPRCAESGVILKTRRGKRLCVRKEKPWVQRIMRRVDEANL